MELGLIIAGLICAVVVGGVLFWKVNKISRQVDELMSLRQQQRLATVMASNAARDRAQHYTESFGLLFDAYLSLPPATEKQNMEGEASLLPLLMSMGKKKNEEKQAARKTQEPSEHDDDDARNSGLKQLQFFEPISGSSWRSLASNGASPPLQNHDNNDDEVLTRLKRAYERSIASYKTISDGETDWEAVARYLVDSEEEKDDENGVPALRFVSKRRREQLSRLLSQQKLSGAEVNYFVRGHVKRTVLKWWRECISDSTAAGRGGSRGHGRVVNSQIGDPGAWGRLGFGARLMGGLLAVNTVLSQKEGKCTWLFGLSRLDRLVAAPEALSQQRDLVFHSRDRQAGSWMPEDLKELVGGYHSDPMAWWFSILATTLVRWDDGIEREQLEYLNVTRHGRPGVDGDLGRSRRKDERERAVVGADGVQQKMKEKSNTRADLRQTIHVGMHIRRTDKVARNEMKFQPTMLYLDRLLRGHPHVRAHPTDLYLATDDRAVPPEVRAILERLQFNITVLFNQGHIGGAKPEVMRFDPTDFALDSFVLSSSDIVVCTLSSNLCRYAYLHMMDRLLDPIASSNLISLDTGFYI